MANKQKYENAKQVAWYADEKALKVLDKLREQEKVDDKPKTRSSYLNDMLIKLGLEKGIIEPPPKDTTSEITNMPPGLAQIISSEVEKALKKALKNQNQGSQRIKKRTA